MRVLVTGATGFVGRSCIEALRRISGTEVIASVRSSPRSADEIQVGDLGPDTDWSTALRGVDVVIHAAARVRQNDRAPGAQAAHNVSNLEGTLRLGRQAVEEGVRRFIFISTIAVNGQATAPGQLFTNEDVPKPEGYYAEAKFKAEQGLAQLAETGLELVIIRPPTVYGRDAPGHFALMLRWVRAGIPLPLGNVNSRRSMVSIENLTDLIVTCVTHPGAVSQTFLVCDDESLSISEWLRHLAGSLGQPLRLIAVPVALLRAGAALLGKRDMGRRLLSSLELDISHTKRRLDWKPPLSVDESLALAVKA